MQGELKTIEVTRDWGTATKSQLQFVPVTDLITQGSDEFQREREQVLCKILYFRIFYAHDDSDTPALFRYAFLRKKKRDPAAALTYADVNKRLFQDPTLQESRNFGASSPVGADTAWRRFNWEFNPDEYEVIHEDREVVGPTAYSVTSSEYRVHKYGDGSSSYSMIDIEVPYEEAHVWGDSTATSDENPVLCVFWLDRVSDGNGDATGSASTANWYYTSTVGVRFCDVI